MKVYCDEIGTKAELCRILKELLLDKDVGKERIITVTVRDGLYNLIYFTDKFDD